MMKKKMAVFALAGVLLGCATSQAPVAPGGSAVTCIRGVVSYVHPVSSATVPYPSAAVTAWRHGTDQGLAQVNANEEGKFCIEVPAVGSVDLRVWGLERIEGKNYFCEGSADNVGTGSITGKCESGNCLEVNVSVQCQERVQRRRGF